MHETGLQSRFSCLAQNVFQSNCKPWTTLSVIYLYHKQDCFFFFHFFWLCTECFPFDWAPGKQSILRNIRFRGSVNLLYRMEAQYLRVVLLSIKQKKIIASAGNRTRVNCLEGSYAHHYTTDALMWKCHWKMLLSFEWNLERANIRMVNQLFCDICL